MNGALGGGITSGKARVNSHVNGELYGTRSYELINVRLFLIAPEKPFTLKRRSNTAARFVSKASTNGVYHRTEGGFLKGSCDNIARAGLL